MDQFNREDFEKLAKIRDKYCVTIFIPTHIFGKEVNEGIDEITFKNKIQKVKEDLESMGMQNAESFLEPAYKLLADGGYWKRQSNALAVFISSNIFNAFRIPITLSEFSTIGPMFELTHLLPLITEDDEFYTLSLSQNRIKLFKNTSFTLQELNISEFVPDSMKEYMTPFDFTKERQVKQTNLRGLSGNSANFKANMAMHGTNERDIDYKYLNEFLKEVDKGVVKALNQQTAPLVVAAVDNVHAAYKNINTYKNLEGAGVFGNPDTKTDFELHAEAYNVISPKINKTRRNDLQKYPAWAGTGKTSYELENIVRAAIEGKVESVFLQEDVHVWGTYDEKSRKLTTHKKREAGDVCIYNLAAIKTIENSGNAYLVSAEEMPEKTIKTSIAATYRY